MFFCCCLTVFIIVSAGLLAHEANFKENHGDDFTKWFSDRLLAAVVCKTLHFVECKPHSKLKLN